MILPDWSRDFPRLFELYGKSNQSASENWFQQPLVVQALTGRHPLPEAIETVREFEASVQELHPTAWEQFKSKARRYVHKTDKWEYHKQLFECFHEGYGYIHLKQDGYVEIQFIEEQPKIPTPDLRGSRDASVVLMEVKTVNESDEQKNYFQIPAADRNAKPAQYDISDAFRKKLCGSIENARHQLISYQQETVHRRIIYLVIRPDFNVHVEQKIEAFCMEQSDAEVEIIMYLLSP